MNGEKLLRAMNGIDEQYLAQALEPAAKPKTRRRSIVAVVSIAAAAILMPHVPTRQNKADTTICKKL